MDMCICIGKERKEKKNTCCKQSKYVVNVLF